MQSKARVIAIQVGALRNYAIPAALARADMLEAFYTDLCAGKGLGRFAAMGSALPLVGPALQRLANREPPPEVLERTFTFDGPALWGQFQEAMVRGPIDLMRVRRQHWAAMGQLMRRRGLGEATHLLSVYGQGHEILRDASEKAIKVISDVNIAPSSAGIVAEEGIRFAEWEAPSMDLGDPGFRELMLTYSNLFLCPSEFVRDDLVSKHGVPEAKTKIIPYAVHEQWLSLQVNPEPGRVLFAGGAQLRKGAHYFAAAASILRKRRPDYRFRLVGTAPERFKNRPECAAIDFVGRLSRSNMPTEFAAADILVLPSLAEGSAGVTYEALGSGVPVVTTREAGSVVRDGIDGFIVPARNPEALADAIERIIENRDLRERMSKAAREQASAYTLKRFQDRLVAAILEA